MRHGSKQAQRCLVCDARFDPDGAEAERRTLGIAVHAIASLIHAEGTDGLYKSHATGSLG